jgi:hypothetical protein
MMLKFFITLFLIVILGVLSANAFSSNNDEV